MLEGMKLKRLWTVLLLSSMCFMVRMFSAAGEGFQISCTEPISGYQNNILTVETPESGKISLEIRDKTTLYRVIETEVPDGKSQIIWDGLGWNEERLNRKQYTVYGTLTGDSGVSYSADTVIEVGPAQQAVLFALPSSEKIYINDASLWFLEFRILYTDQLQIEFFDKDTDAAVLKTVRQAKGGRVNQLSWNMMTNKHKLQAGDYRVRISGQQHPASYKEFSLEVLEGDQPVLPLEITGDIMPSEDDSDEVIWSKMISPATVVDIASTAHQKVFAEPDADSRVLGTLHGQSQSLSVLEIGEKWVRISAWNHESGSPVEGWVPKKVLKVVQPCTEYGLLINKRKQTLTLYHQGEKIDTLLVSTGRMEKGELYQETAAGSFLTDIHMSDYSTNGLKYDFVIRYDGGNLLHQIPYAWSESGKKDMIPGEVYLGTKASHACIRIQEKPSETGLNAYWFWTHLPYHTRVIVLDDPVERTNFEKIITGNTPDLEAGLLSAWRVESDEQEERRITLTFAGDVALGGREQYYNVPEGLPSYLETYGMNWPFAELNSFFASDDLTVVNLECVLKNDAEGEDKSKKWRFRGLTDYVQALPAGSIELVNIANNHTIDYGDEGYQSTVETLKAAGIPYCGNENNQLIELDGFVVGFGGCRETTFCEDPGIIERDIREMKANGADYIIYQCHWGTEYDGNHNVLQESMARSCVRAGADLVIGHHPHVVQGIDVIDGVPIIYSLGNLMFGGTLNLSTYEAMLVRVYLYPERAENRTEICLVPVLTSGEAAKKVNNYQPVIARNEDALQILRNVQKDTAQLLTDLAILNY